jgi:hypothetical protein
VGVVEARQPHGNELKMSMTVFFALCILGMDFLIYFFFKLVYGEKHRVQLRRLPAEYYNDASTASAKDSPSPLYLVPARKNHPGKSKHTLSMPAPRLDHQASAVPKRPPYVGVPRRDVAELLAYRRITS